MSKRIKLGLIFNQNDGWIGGSYYILNLISALATLEDSKQPIITVLSKVESNFEIVKKTGYKYLKFKNPYDFEKSKIENLFANFVFYFFKKSVIDKRISQKNIDILFPSSNEYCYERISKKIFWFADFQHIIYPAFFSSQEIEQRDSFLKEVANSNATLILSSQDAKKNWDSLNFKKKCNVSVIPFAVTLPEINSISFESVLKEFNITENYIIISNQFWKHKNHIVVLKAALLLKEQGVKLQFVFTGKEDDYRNPRYFKILTDYVSTNNLFSTVRFLGLIDRQKQLVLLKNSIAIIQPSLFEGWSTIVEDAKSLSCKIIVSDIDVHREQLYNNMIFFNPESEFDLVSKIKNVKNSETHFPKSNYSKNIEFYGNQFYNALLKIHNN